MSQVTEPIRLLLRQDIEFQCNYEQKTAFKQFEEILTSTVKHVLSGHLKIDKTKVLMENGCLMKVERIAECSPWSILQYFWPALSDTWY